MNDINLYLFLKHLRHRKDKMTIRGKAITSTAGSWASTALNNKKKILLIIYTVAPANHKSNFCLMKSL